MKNVEHKSLYQIDSKAIKSLLYKPQVGNLFSGSFMA